jgi:hypothetical protein
MRLIRETCAREAVCEHEFVPSCAACPILALLLHLLRLVLLARSEAVPDSLRLELASVSARNWWEALPELDSHRLTPMVMEAVDRRRLHSHVPQEILERMSTSFRDTVLVNRLYAHALRELLGVLQERGFDAVVLKGIALADWLYPELATRPMVDIDLLVPRERALELEGLLRERGFERPAPWRGFVHPTTGITVDVHGGWHGSPRGEIDDLTLTRTLPSLGGDAVRVWEPNAMLVYLSAHLEKHTRVFGPSLLWILDILLLVRECGGGISLARLRELAAEEAPLELLWQTLRFARDQCGFEVPAALVEEVAQARALSLPWVLRQRRLQRWGFPYPRFYVRFAARLLRLRPLEGRKWLHWTDVPNGWIDQLVDRRCSPRGDGTDRVAVP